MVTEEAQAARVAAMKFASVYPLYVAKVQRKGRSVEELHKVIEWLTGYGTSTLARMLTTPLTMAEFFEQATLHPNATLITGKICGYKIEDITHPLLKQTRYLDKLVDELAKGRAMEKILRS